MSLQSISLNKYNMPILNPSTYGLLLRPLLFRLPPETAHKVADMALSVTPFWRALAPALRARDPRLSMHLCGLKLRNPVGLAAGYDKNCQRLPALAGLGFGYLTGGTVTASPRPGNPKPRIYRIPRQQSIINAMGFPGEGLEAVARRLEHARKAMSGTPVVVSVSGTTVDQILVCHQRLEPLVDAVEINISSPNTEGLRVFHEPSVLANLLSHINDSRVKPLMVKLPPYPKTNTQDASDNQVKENLLNLAGVCAESGVDALTVANTRPIRDSRLSTGVGGLSGRAIFPEMLRMVADVRSHVGDRLAINACGGIFTGQDAWESIKAGATTVQLYTALVYRGPEVARSINTELLNIMARENLQSLDAKPPLSSA